MNLLLRQIWALVRKNLLIFCARRPVSTFIRAFALPLVIVLVLAYSKEFFASPEHWGVSSPREIRSFKDGLKASADHDNIFGLIDNGMTGGAVSSVLNSLATIAQDAGKTPTYYKGSQELERACAVGLKGTSVCYGGIEFLSSPDEGSTMSEKGFWNYTIFGQSNGGSIDMRGNDNRVEIYILPLQRAVDEAIIAMSPDASAPLPLVKGIGYTGRSQESLNKDRTSTYLALSANIFGVVFAFAMVGIVYHLTTFVATERQLGMSSLIDTMVPGGSTIRARLIRHISTYVSFVIIYLPSWIAIGVVMSVVVLPDTSRSIPVGYHIFSGLAFTSFSLFGACFFKRPQLSGSVMVVIIVIFAVIPQVLWEQTRAMVIIFSLLVPSANYTYFITGVTHWEMAHQKIDITKTAPGDYSYEEVNRQSVQTLWALLAVQIVVYPVLAFFLEQLLFSTNSAGRNFAAPSDAQAATVTLSDFSKTYKPSIFARLFKKRKDVPAVTNMNMRAYPGQILCLLGPNGSGKSTTLNCISGQQKVTSGNITIDPTGGFGYAPQVNVIWPNLTVKEHLQIFSDLKCISDVNDEVITELVKSCDLESKLAAQAQTLSGGQKRKLQLAMMFAGGSTVCCVDEVSTGLDPISRRRIWEILLAERSRRTIIMTTHFLDEADFLADNIVIMYKGSLKAEGTSATLKNRYGDGYTVKLPKDVDLNIPLSGPMEKELVRHQMVYRVADAALVAELIEQLEKRNIKDYQVSGPTMEELFMKTTGDHIMSENSATAPDSHDDIEAEAPVKTLAMDDDESYQLSEGRPISVLEQWWLLFSKRWLILRRRYIPYFIILAFSIVGAAIAPLLIKSFRKPMECPEQQDLVGDGYGNWRSSLSTGGTYGEYLIGPADAIDDNILLQIADIYSTNRSSYGEYYGFRNVTQLEQIIVPISEYENLTRSIQEQHKPKSYSYSQYDDGYASTNGGFWLKDTVTMLYNVEYGPQSVLYTQNLLNNMLGGVPINAGFSSFPPTNMATIFDFKPLMFIVYYGLIMACYPAFFALYPTTERISNVRSMQYSNGIRPLPLWLSHLAFDGVFVLVISVVGTALLAASTPVWFGLGYVFLILLLYGLVSALLSYIISMFAKTAVAGWFMCALGQVAFYFAYFGGMIGVQSSTAYYDLESVSDALFFGLGLFSPVVNLERALMIGLGQFATLCNGHSAGSIHLFGGPILYLILQLIFLSVLLLWWDSSFTLPSLLHRGPNGSSPHVTNTDPEKNPTVTTSESPALAVSSVTKRFRKNLAVDDISFSIPPSSIFALLGPNGAGKSTLISMIRGDIAPSTRTSQIHIAGHSILSSPISARSNLGVCPQFDSADILTVSETLRFYARTRGVADIEANTRIVIDACGLADYTNALAFSLSGGTKRKLSLAIALIGNPRVLVLDEPSSALDANAKRKLWTTLQRVSKGRAVLLTTHSMEEADALADTLGIVSSRMLAVGGREDMKARAGVGLHVHLVAASAPQTSEAEIERMRVWVEGTWPGARLGRDVRGGQVRFEIPDGGDGVGNGERVSVGSVMRTLEGMKGELGIEFYSVGRAGLDEVFERIVRGEAEV